jgi:predicted nucleotidyltransferase
MTGRRRDLPEGATTAARGIVAQAARSMMRRADDVAGETAEAATTRAARRIPQGFTERQWTRFARGARQTQRQAGLPDGDLVAHGSRVRGTARPDSDIDVALIVDDKTFFDLAERSLARAPDGTRLRRTMLRRINENGQLASFDLGTDFTHLRRELMDTHVPHKVQFSVLRRGGKFDNGPFLPLD